VDKFIHSSERAMARGEPEEARRLLLRAARKGHAEAQWRLGGMDYEGEGGPQDYGEARRWYGLAMDWPLRRGIHWPSTTSVSCWSKAWAARKTTQRRGGGMAEQRRRGLQLPKMVLA